MEKNTANKETDSSSEVTKSESVPLDTHQAVPQVVQRADQYNIEFAIQ